MRIGRSNSPNAHWPLRIFTQTNVVFPFPFSLLFSFPFPFFCIFSAFSVVHLLDFQTTCVFFPRCFTLPPNLKKRDEVRAKKRAHERERVWGRANTYMRVRTQGRERGGLICWDHICERHYLLGPQLRETLSLLNCTCARAHKGEREEVLFVGTAFEGDTLFLELWVYEYILVCICMCVCVRERDCWDHIRGRHSLCLIVRLWVPFRLYVYVCKRDRERERERERHTHTLTHTLSFCPWNFCALARKTKMVWEKDFFVFERNIVFFGPLLRRASQKNITKTFSLCSKNEILLSKLQGSFEL